MLNQLLNDPRDARGSVTWTKVWRVGVVILLGIVAYALSLWFYLERNKGNAPGERSTVQVEVKGARREPAKPSAPAVGAIKQPEAVNLGGQWAGRILVGSSPVEFSFKFKVTGDQLTGTATFPIGEGSIQNGKLEGSPLSFTTQHQLKSGPLVTTKFSGTVLSGESIAMVMQSEGGESTLTVDRVSR